MILEKLKQKDLFTDAEQQVADYICRNPETVVQISLKKLAKESFSSEATIIRTCRKAGADGFADMKIMLAYELNSYLLGDRDVMLDFPIQKEDDDRQIAQKLLNLSCRSLTDTYQKLDMNRIRRAAAILAKAKGVSVYGRSESLIIAEDFYLKLIKIGIRACLDMGNGFQEVRSRGYFPGEASVVVSCYADSVDADYIVEEMCRHKTPVILVTGNPRSPLVKKATLAVVAETEEARFKLGAFSTRISLEYVLDCIYCVLFSMNYETNLKRLQEFHRQINRKRYLTENRE